MAHPGIVTVAAAILDQELERAIRLSLPNCNSDMAKRLFGEFGPFGSFSAKIDVAHALGITSDFIYQELQKVRKMRNMFSHSSQLLNLADEPMKSKFDALIRPPGATGNYSEVFMACVLVIDDYLEKYLYGMGDRGPHLSLRWITAEQKTEAPAG